MEGEGGPCFHEVTFIDQDGRLKTSRVPVVQELSRRGVTRLPERFIQLKPRHQDEVSLTQSCADSLTLQLIDMSKARDGSGEELAKLARGAKEDGMFLIKEHGIDPDVLDEMKAAVQEFFGLSFEDKKKSVGSYASTDNMGYGRNFVKSDDQILEWIDRLAVKALPKGATDGLNVWPQRPANFRPTLETYVDQARKVLDQVLESLAKSFSLDKHVFLQPFDPERSEVNVRVNFYPPCPRPDLTLGVTPHSDASALTLLVELDAGTGGLQVLRGQEQQSWRTVKWPRGALLVNVGDLLEILSDGRVKSPWHRAVTQSDMERISIALFYNPPSDAEVVPVAGGTGSYRKVVVGDYCRHLYKISPTESKEAIFYAKQEN